MLYQYWINEPSPGLARAIGDGPTEVYNSQTRNWVPVDIRAEIMVSGEWVPATKAEIDDGIARRNPA